MTRTVNARRRAVLRRLRRGQLQAKVRALPRGVLLLRGVPAERVARAQGGLRGAGREPRDADEAVINLILDFSLRPPLEIEPVEVHGVALARLRELEDEEHDNQARPERRRRDRRVVDR